MIRNVTLTRKDGESFEDSLNNWMRYEARSGNPISTIVSIQKLDEDRLDIWYKSSLQTM